MKSPANNPDDVSDRVNTARQWVTYLSEDVFGPIAVYLIFPCLVVVAVILLGCLFKHAPIIPALLLGAFPCVFVPLLLFRLHASWRKSKSVKRNTNAISDRSRALLLELSGAYKPYIIEAAEELGSSGERAIVPDLISVLELTVRGERPGWQDIATALIVALGDLGDSRALPALESMLNVRDLCDLPALLTAIEMLGNAESNDQLLRPINFDPSAVNSLLRPASEIPVGDGAEMLRPAD